MSKSILHNKPLSFVDVESTGTNAINGRIIEIGIVRVEDNKVVSEYQTLLNPEVKIDPFIEQMTGINYAELVNAPLFSDVKDEIYRLLNDSIFVAHNVRFDYSFIRNEFRRVGISFTPKHFDTVKLARILYPGHAHYNLDAIMQRHNIVNVGRHRAFGDAKVLWDFFNQAKNTFETKTFEDALKIVLKKPTLPVGLSREVIDALPETPGVYLFFGNGSMPLYIGKSINIKDRVLSHFANDYMSHTDMKIIQTVKSVEAIETAGELSALLLESSLIKKEQPVYNRLLRQSQKMLVLLKTQNKDGYNVVEFKNTDEISINEIEFILGVFRNKKQLTDSLYNTCKEFKLCPKLMHLDKSRDSCFYYQLEECNGACIGKEQVLKYNLRFDEAFFHKKVKAWNFPKPLIIKELGNRSEIHLIDKWCYLGSIKDESEDLSNLQYNYRFDWDTYKILRRYISNKNNQSTISFYTKKIQNEV